MAQALLARRQYPEQNFRSLLGVIRLGKTYGDTLHTGSPFVIWLLRSPRPLASTRIYVWSELTGRGRFALRICAMAPRPTSIALV